MRTVGLVFKEEKKVKTEKTEEKGKKVKTEKTEEKGKKVKTEKTEETPELGDENAKVQE